MHWIVFMKLEKWEACIGERPTQRKIKKHCSLLAGALIDGIPGVSGFRQYFGFLIVMLLLGVVFVCVWIKYLKKTKKEETVK